jgi:hypothetical protein
VIANDLGWLDAVALRDLVADGEITPAELADSAIARIDVANPVLNAVVVPLPDIGRALAADPALPRGPFHGVPFLLKDVGACLAGLPLYMGNGLLRSLDWRAPADTILGARFRAAGLVTIGKTALPEFGCQPTTQPIAFGACRNPWDTLRSTAGSSGGAAAAVAAGLVPVAHASDIGGSIRLPAAWCGVVGLKPSRGRTSSLPITDPNLVEHVITRSVRDTAAFLDAVGGADPTDTYHLPPPDVPYATTMSEAPDGLRIGLPIVGTTTRPRTPQNSHPVGIGGLLYCGPTCLQHCGSPVRSGGGADDEAFAYLGNDARALDGAVVVDRGLVASRDRFGDQRPQPAGALANLVLRHRMSTCLPLIGNGDHRQVLADEHDRHAEEPQRRRAPRPCSRRRRRCR